jgi:hypothetical protein
MPCTANPVRATLSPDGNSLVLTWPKTVTYSGGSAWDRASFTVNRTNGRQLFLRRDRVGVAAEITISSVLQSFHSVEKDPTAGSTFTRCDPLAD